MLDAVRQLWPGIIQRAWPIDVTCSDTRRNKPVIAGTVGCGFGSPGPWKLDLHSVFERDPAGVCVAARFNHRNRVGALIPTPQERMFFGVGSNRGSGCRLERHSHTVSIDLFYPKQLLVAILKDVVIVDDFDPVVRAQTEAGFASQVSQSDNVTLPLHDREDHRTVL